MQILGLDIGGTGIKGALVDTGTGELDTERFRLDTPQPATPQAVSETAKAVVEHFKWDGYVGCGFPAAIRHDIVKTASNISDKWIGMNASELLENATGCKTHLLNDVDAAGYAEMTFGAGKGNMGSVIMTAAGTGIGTALFTRGVLFPNCELGFVKVKGMDGEHYAAGSVKKKEELTWKEWAKRYNKYLRRLEKLFWPDLFILGGGISKKFDKYESYFDLDTPVVPAMMKNNAGIIGAALAAKDYYESVKGGWPPASGR